jgi:para-nitrobenzyl esterase
MRAFASALDCGSDADAVACLRQKTTAQILALAMQPNPSMGGFFGKAQWTFSVVVDGAGGFVPEPPRDLLARGDFAKVPYLLGSNNDEGTLFTLTTSIGSEAEYRTLLDQAYGKNAERVFAQYPASAFNSDFKAAYTRLVGDSSLVCGTHDVARRAAKAGAKVFMYNFNVTWTVGFGTLGAAHGSEIGHVFGTPYMPSDGTIRVAEAMNSYWGSFARTGDPNFTGAPKSWPSFTADSDQRLQLDEDFSVLKDFRADACAFWATLYDEAASAP